MAIPDEATGHADGAPPIQVGERVGIENPLTGSTVRGVFSAIEQDRIVIVVDDDPGRLTGAFGLRRLDADGGAWYADVEGTYVDERVELIVSLPRAWERDAARNSARFPIPRMPVQIETNPPNSLRRELAAIDISATGLGATGQGAAPRLGTPVRITLDAGGAQRWIHAIVVRTSPRSYNSYDIGLRFAPESDGERQLILLWRDLAARGGR